MAFNYKKAQADDTLNYQKKLEEKRDDMNQSSPDEGNTELQLKHNYRKDDDASVPFNKQLESARTGTNNGVTEKSLDGNSKVYNEKRDDTTHNRNAKSQDLVAEAHDQAKLEKFREAQNGQERDTSFWDDYVGVQMLGPETKIVANKQKSQLPNHPDRYKGLKPEIKKEIDELVMASSKQADKMQFHIFAKAAMQDRDLNEDEKQMIRDINGSKARMLAAYETANDTGVWVNPKTAQFGNGLPAGVPARGQGRGRLQFDGGGDFPSNPPSAGDAMGKGLGKNDGPLVLNYDDGGSVRVVNSRGESIDRFDSAGEAKAHYPEVEV